MNKESTSRLLNIIKTHIKDNKFSLYHTIIKRLHCDNLNLLYYKSDGNEDYSSQKWIIHERDIDKTYMIIEENALYGVMHTPKLIHQCMKYHEDPILIHQTKSEYTDDSIRVFVNK
jgi:hypothetical protein